VLYSVIWRVGVETVYVWDVRGLVCIYLRNAIVWLFFQGRRFLSFLFTWNVNFIKLIHETIKNQLLCFPSCIQDFMHHAVHLPRKSPLHAKVREILSYFHKQNKCRQGVEEVLYRLYQPILWRALKARNSEIRSNATLLFSDAFPILDPRFNRKDLQKEIQRQFDEIFILLDDPQPLIRSTGVLAVSKITYKYWEMIPAVMLAQLLKTLIEDLAFDASSADVRCAVFKCLPVILDNILSHPLLEQLLPILKYNLHDNSEKVRVAFVDMLLKIKATKAAKFWKICPVQHLLTRLEIDSRPVSRRLVNLLISSFLPISQPEVWCERCLTLIQMNASAARTFYQYAHEYASPTNIAKLMLAIRNCLNECIQQQLKEFESEDEHSEKENMSVTNNLFSVDNILSMAGLLEIIVILWRSIQKPLDGNKEAKNHIVQKFASVLPTYLKIFKDDRCVSPIIILASFIPPTAIPTFSCGVISKLKKMENGVIEKKYSTLLDCLCRWGKLGHILELICDWITAESRNRESKPELALDYFEYLLTHSMNRHCLLSLSREKLNEFLNVLECGKVILSSFSQQMRTQIARGNTLALAFSLYCRFSIHLLHQFVSEKQNYLSALEKIGTWIENSILPHFLLEEEEGYLKLSKTYYFILFIVKHYSFLPGVQPCSLLPPFHSLTILCNQPGGAIVTGTYIERDNKVGHPLFFTVFSVCDHLGCVPVKSWVSSLWNRLSELILDTLIMFPPGFVLFCFLFFSFLFFSFLFFSFLFFSFLFFSFLFFSFLFFSFQANDF
uniref:Non-SMC condensin II complex subunit G2 n=1 Tax=Laticauda laticaudata TaxID=8630 RepID=A0A8C5WZI8_LATLA